MKLLVALSLLVIVGTVSGLNCFQCNSETDSACSDDFKEDSVAINNAFNKTCPEPQDGDTLFCRKIRYAIHEPSEIRIQRDCGYKKREGYDCYQKRSEDYVIDTCQCDNDLCNGAPSFSTSATALVAITIPIIARYL